MKQRIFLIFILSIIISCSKKTESEIKKYPLIENAYSGAFDTFYQYIKTLNNNELNDDNTVSYTHLTLPTTPYV